MKGDGREEVAGSPPLAALTADKQVLLSGFLGQLPGHVAARLAKAVEVDRLNGGTGLPHDEILDALRPQLCTVPEALRTPTPQRLFCRPFEDILVSPERKTKQKGRIARSSIRPVWTWLQNELMPKRHGELTELIREGLIRERHAEVEARLADLWREAASVLRPTFANEQRKVVAARALGSLWAAEDAAEMALLIGNASEVLELQERLARPVANLTDEDIAFIRDLFDRVCMYDPDVAPYMALVAMGRLERPWEALRLAAVVSRKSTDTMIANTDMGIVGELLFSDLDAYTRKIEAVRPANFDAEALLSNLAAFAELSSGMVKELGIRRDGKWGQRLAKDRGTVAGIMEGLLERAPREILAALPPHKAGSFAKAKLLDVSRAPDPERISRAMRYAYLMVHCQPFSVAAAFSAKLNEAIDEISIALRSYNEEILSELRSTPPDARANAKAHFAYTLDISKLILGEEEADFLRRRSHIAAAHA